MQEVSKELQQHPWESRETFEDLRTSLGDGFDLVVRTIKYIYPAGGNAEETVITVEDSFGKQVFDFSDLIPIANPKEVSKIFFVLGKAFASRPALYAVTFSLEALRDPKEVFGILHELGHVAAEEKRGLIYSKEVMNAKTSAHGLTDTRASRIVLQNERDAWAEAIRLGRKIKKEHGLNLFKLFGSADEFMGWLRVTGLRSYELALEKLGKHAFTKEDKVRFWEDVMARERLVNEKDFTQTQEVK